MQKSNDASLGRILLFNNALSGGAGRSILTLAQALDREGFTVHLSIYESKIDYPVPESIVLHRLSTEEKNKKAVAEALKQLLDKHGPYDMVMSNSSPANRILSMIDPPGTIHCIRSAETKRFPDTPMGRLRSMWRRRRYQRLYDGKRLLTVSSGLERYIVRDLGAKPASVRTIYNPFELAEIRRLAATEDPEIPTEEFLIHVGRLDLVHKRHDVLLEAYKLADPPMPLVLLGEGRDEEKIRHLIKRLGLEKRVSLIGRRSNPYPWISKARLLILSSDFEGFPRVLIEAFALETPVVSTDCPSGPSDILTGDFSTFLSPPDDAEKLAENIGKALSGYPKIEPGLIERFDSTIIAKEYADLIRTMKGKNVV